MDYTKIRTNILPTLIDLIFGMATHFYDNIIIWESLPL
jgi:hypothetical protein